MTSQNRSHESLNTCKQAHRAPGPVWSGLHTPGSSSSPRTAFPALHQLSHSLQAERVRCNQGPNSFQARGWGMGGEQCPQLMGSRGPKAGAGTTCAQVVAAASGTARPAAPVPAVYGGTEHRVHAEQGQAAPGTSSDSAKGQRHLLMPPHAPARACSFATSRVLSPDAAPRVLPAPPPRPGPPATCRPTSSGALTARVRSQA